jgi:hypothetical protein
MTEQTIVDPQTPQQETTPPVEPGQGAVNPSPAEQAGTDQGENEGEQTGGDAA